VEEVEEERAVSADLALDARLLLAGERPKRGRRGGGEGCARRREGVSPLSLLPVALRALLLCVRRLRLLLLRLPGRGLRILQAVIVRRRGEGEGEAGGGRRATRRKIGRFRALLADKEVGQPASQRAGSEGATPTTAATACSPSPTEIRARSSPSRPSPSPPSSSRERVSERERGSESRPP